MVGAFIAGRTGDGKSAFARLVAIRLGVVSPPFAESAGGGSHTHQPISCSSGGVEITDTPGLMDTQGVTKDNENIRKIVTYAQEKKEVNAFLLVVNEQAPRFDSGMQDAVKLIVDSFGKDALVRMGFVFTRAYGTITLQQARITSTQYSQMIAARTGFAVPDLPCWQVDCHPEAFAALGVPEDRIIQSKQKTATAVDELLQWVRTRPAMPTVRAAPAVYDHQRLLDEEKKRNAVVSRVTETQTRETGRTSTPIMGTVNKTKRVWKGGFVPKWGNACKDTVHSTETVQTGTSVTKHMCKETREVQTLGSGKKIFGAWQVVQTWNEAA